MIRQNVIQLIDETYALTRTDVCQWDSLITRFYNAARVISDLPLYRRSGHSTVDREFEITRNAASTTGRIGGRETMAKSTRPASSSDLSTYIHFQPTSTRRRPRSGGGDLRPVNGTENPVVIVVDYLQRKRPRFPTRNYDRTSETAYRGKPLKMHFIRGKRTLTDGQ